ncbi:HupE/UreJ family protein [Croceibacterium sp. LX-88]|uniref:HupE/UreJ family protein n=1 Tax=Croceibacterium selenioxidans TaxID=2838833 RepID=A0ABS5W7M7_9SPHN|nr:HupE/UreJ family protein [Croceibacterium selenioxidans]MBT2135753.1 HupE/UreJ family protein [Croceibacterium selenioxidans]
MRVRKGDTSWSLLRWLVALLALLLAVPASAHPVPFSYLDLEVHDDAVTGRVRAHLTDIAPVLGIADPQTLLDPQVQAAHQAQIERYIASRISFENGGFARAKWGGLAVVDEDEALELTFTIEGKPPGALPIRAHLFAADPNHQTFVNVYEGDGIPTQYIFSSASEPKTYYRGTSAGAVAVVKTFIPSGVHHIMIGPDHILFLIGLLLLGGSLRQLITIVTAFTIGHSITLSLASLNILTPPSWLIEPAIALSIVVVGVDNLLQRKGEGRDLRAWAALFFGLIHGFGFANVLKEFGLPQEALGWSLFSFNVGVELGQLAIVAVVGALLEVIRRRRPALSGWIVVIGSLVVIAAGGYWFVERVFFGG